MRLLSRKSKPVDNDWANFYPNGGHYATNYNFNGDYTPYTGPQCPPLPPLRPGVIARSVPELGRDGLWRWTEVVRIWPIGSPNETHDFTMTKDGVVRWCPRQPVESSLYF